MPAKSFIVLVLFVFVFVVIIPSDVLLIVKLALLKLPRLHG